MGRNSGGAWVQRSNGSWTWTPGATPNPTAVQQYGVSTLTNPARNPNGGLGTGSWYQAPLTWKWVPGATPDPTLAATYGQGAMTNPNETPDGSPEHSPHPDAGAGAWVPQAYTGTWVWQWGLSPDPELDPGGYSDAVLTNPDQAPDGSMGPGNPDSPDYPPENDVVPPTLTDIWGGTAPDVTGILPGGASSPGPGQPAASSPPSHPAYLVAPGSIRDAENAGLAALDTQITDYDNLKTYVAQSANQQLYSATLSPVQLKTTQDNLLQNIADTIEACGNFWGMCNYAAQNYAASDIQAYEYFQESSSSPTPRAAPPTSI
jgi:hypothetical protein